MMLMIFWYTCFAACSPHMKSKWLNSWSWHWPANIGARGIWSWTGSSEWISVYL
jgi:hypothetical protein